MKLIQEKTTQALALLQEFGIDCWITFVRESGINGDPILPFLIPGEVTWHAAFLFTRDGRRLAVVGQYDRPMVLETGVYDQVVGFVTGFREPLKRMLRELDPSRIALNYSRDSEVCDGLTHGMYLTLKELLQELGMADRIVSAEPIISALRERKTAEEIEAIREAVAHSEAIWQAVWDFLRPGLSEAEVAAFVHRQIQERGLTCAWDPSTCPAVFSGPETAEAHYHPTERRLQPGHLLNMDFGVKARGYNSDMQRTFYLLEPGERIPPEEVVRGFDTIVQAIQAAREALRPGVQGHQVDAVAREFIVQQGYEEFPHGLGHQVGRLTHDGTALLGPPWEKYAGKPFKPVEVGMVFTLEPRLKVPGRGTVTIEEMVLVTKEGAEWLSTPQTELWLVPAREQ